MIEKDLESHKSVVKLLNSDTSLNMLDRVVSTFSNSCYNSAEANTVKSKTLDETRNCSSGIFDDIEDVYLRRQALTNNEGWEELRKESVEYIKKDVSTTEHRNWTNVLKSKDTKDIWNKINWKGTFITSAQSEKPELLDLASQFSEKGQAGRESTVLCDANSTNYVPLHVFFFIRTQLIRT